MTTVTLNLPDEVEYKLQARARVQGRDMASVALELVEQGLRADTKRTGPEDLTHEQWLQELDAWVKSLPKVDVVLDVSRESIYEGRGE